MSNSPDTRFARALWATMMLGALLMSGRCALWNITAGMSWWALGEVEGTASPCEVWRPVAELVFGLAQIAFASWLSLVSALGLTRRRSVLPVLRVTYAVGLVDATLATMAALWTGATIILDALGDISNGLTVVVFAVFTVARVGFFIPLAIFHGWVLRALHSAPQIDPYFRPTEPADSTPTWLLVVGILVATFGVTLAALAMVLLRALGQS